ncbi:hypothetical protein BJI69_16240 [Luteibacter rhizovicinus DSM 16549]|uniref:Uncharacterized protein n=1 Tax=Luteibacter rhizovicinus DSM 16549 TaxID=1440763 RepID=A0A0G9HDS9_9GAMM|nr:hypothetical protein BJI69_16240 [Luteibacter rhizovicinus DSM 16549]KLD67915.1 hypothetical protein Y883_05915 [Luteibacter rhizovicinus DSM 16549]
MRGDGFSLVELMVGLAVASIVAAAATVSLVAAGSAARRHLVMSRDEDRARLALAAIVRDLEAAAAWHMCTEARDCPQKTMAREYNTPVLLAGSIGWLVADELRRCDTACQTYVQGVIHLEVVADLPDTDGLVERQPFQQRHGAGARAIEITLTMRDGRHYSRVVSRPEKTS